MIFKKLLFSSVTVIFLGVFNSLRADSNQNENRIHLSFVGDILLHQILQRQAMNHGFESLWKETIPVLSKAHFRVGNLEGPITPRNFDRTHGTFRGDLDLVNLFPKRWALIFEYPYRVVKDLRKAGFNLLTVANNHIMDQGPNGALATHHAILQEEMIPLGSNIGQSDFGRIIRIKDRNIAFLACTFSLNGFRDPERMILSCYDHEKIRSELGYLRRQASIIIMLPHWGVEYQTRHSPVQENLARQWASWGADVIVGTHPHVVQDTQVIHLDKEVLAEETKEKKQALVFYSLGNFVSAQKNYLRRLTMILHLSICPTEDMGNLEVCGWSFTPMVLVPKAEGLLSLIVDHATTSSNLNNEERSILIKARQDLKKILFSLNKN